MDDTALALVRLIKLFLKYLFAILCALPLMLLVFLWFSPFSYNWAGEILGFFLAVFSSVVMTGIGIVYTIVSRIRTGRVRFPLIASCIAATPLALAAAFLVAMNPPF
jgi:hypothetical protein